MDRYPAYYATHVLLARVHTQHDIHACIPSGAAKDHTPSPSLPPPRGEPNLPPMADPAAAAAAATAAPPQDLPEAIGVPEPRRKQQRQPQPQPQPQPQQPAPPASLRFEDLTIDDSLTPLERIARYCRSGIALQRLVHVKMMGSVAASVG